MVSEQKSKTAERLKFTTFKKMLTKVLNYYYYINIITQNNYVYTVYHNQPTFICMY